MCRNVYKTKSRMLVYIQYILYVVMLIKGNVSEDIMDVMRNFWQETFPS